MVLYFVLVILMKLYLIEDHQNSNFIFSKKSAEDPFPDPH